MGPESRDWVPLIPSDSYPEMGGVWLGRVLINAQIAAGLLRSDRRQGQVTDLQGRPIARGEAWRRSNGDRKTNFA